MNDDALFVGTRVEAARALLYGGKPGVTFAKPADIPAKLKLLLAREIERRQQEDEAVPHD